MKRLLLTFLTLSFVVSGTGLYAQEGIQTSASSFLKKVDGGIRSLHPVVKFAGVLTCLVTVSLIKELWDDYVESKNPVDNKDKNNVAIALAENDLVKLDPNSEQHLIND